MSTRLNRQILRNAKQRDIRRAIQHVVALKIKGIINLKYARRMMKRILRALKSKSVTARIVFVTDFEFKKFGFDFCAMVTNTNRMQRICDIQSLKLIA